jgi:hypothetical protein
VTRGSDKTFPVDKLSALRLGGSLVAEVEASRPEYRAWVEIRQAGVVCTRSQI